MEHQVYQHIKSDRIVQVVSGDHHIQNALDIPPLSHQEARVLMAEEAHRTLALFETLSDEDWAKPTACTRWNVHQVAAHLVGESAGFASWREFYRQYLSLSAKSPYRRDHMSFIDALNQLMVDDRAAAKPADLIAELREAAPKAIKLRLRLPAVLRAIRLPMPLLGTVRIDYLTDMIYPRDTWMHRVDISRATGRDLVLDAQHDGRITTLVIRDLAFHLVPHLDGESIILELDSPAGGEWHIGGNPSPAARIVTGLVEFMMLASGRLTPKQAATKAIIHGDQQLGTRVLEQTTVPF